MADMKQKMKSMMKPATALFLLGTALALSGCVSDEIMTGSIDDARGRGSENYPITVVKGPQTIEIDTSKGHLSAEQIDAIRGFVHQAQSAGVTPMTVARPSAGGPAFQVTGEVAQIIVEQGVPRDRVQFVTYGGRGKGPVRISFISTYARTKVCGVWQRDLTNTYENDDMDNFGCAVQSNIAAMTADPETFIVPKTPENRLADRDVTAIKNLSPVGASASSSSSSTPAASSGSGVTP